MVEFEAVLFRRTILSLRGFFLMIGVKSQKGISLRNAEEEMKGRCRKNIEI
jgi:hypothetical protein